MLVLPPHIQEEFDKLSYIQKSKFYELVQWASASGLQGVKLPMNFEVSLEMAKRMGEDAITPIEPDKTVNHDWEFQPKPNRS